MNWVKTSDRLPEHNKRVMLYGRAFPHMITRHCYVGLLNEPMKTWHSMGKQLEEVTHWAEIEPPKD